MPIVHIDTPDFLISEELSLFEGSVEKFLDRHAAPDMIDSWRVQKSTGPGIWKAAGDAGFLGVSVPEDLGGAGGDFRHEVILIQSVGRRGADGFAISLHNPVILPYLTAFGTEAQKSLWLPQLCSGEMVGAIAMTEPSAGSDLQGMLTHARKVDEGYLISGQKTFISNGQLSDFIIVAVKTDQSAGPKGLSLFIVQPSTVAEGFRRGRNLDKVGMEAQDTSELFFDEVYVPDENLLGGIPGRGFAQLMQKLPQERLVIAWQAMAMIERALGETIEYVRERKMFGQALADFQNTQFRLAEFKTEATIAKVFLAHCSEKLMRSELTSEKASMAKYWVSELLSRIVDGCLQFFGGYGFMLEYPIGRMYRDSRIHRIYGGSNEVMKLLIARGL